MNPEAFLSWYQGKIGLYDKQSWETTVEQHILRGLSYSPCKSAKIKTDLIDVDLIRGSTFPKAKPQNDIWFAGLEGIVRLLLCPFYLTWWIKETTTAGFLLIMSMYCSAISAAFIYYKYEHLKNITPFEVYLPFFLLLLLSVIYSQMTCTRRKGIKLPIALCNKENFLKRRRRSSSSRRSFLSKNKGSFVKRDYGPNGMVGPTDAFTNSSRLPGKNSKNESASNRSHSEDVYKSEGLEKDNRSTSENNILHSKAQNLLSYQSKVKNSILNNCILEGKRSYFPVGGVEEDLAYCGLRRRPNACGGKGDGQEAKINSESAAQMEDLQQSELRSMTSLEYDVTSEAGSDGCSADCESPNSEGESPRFGGRDHLKLKRSKFSPRHSLPNQARVVTVSNSSCESDAEEEQRVPPLQYCKFSHHNGFGITTNSEDPSYSSESEAGWEDIAGAHQSRNEGVDWLIQGAPAAVISSTKQVSNKDISSAVISRVDVLKHSCNYLTFGLIMSVVLALVPTLHRLLVVPNEAEEETASSNKTGGGFELLEKVVGGDKWSAILVSLNMLNRLILGASIFFLLSVAERTFKQRFLYAKHFCYLTSARRARKYDLPHFRLNKVINIKAWLSIRSCLKKRGPQHSIDVIVSATFILTLVLVFYLGVEAIKDEEKNFQPLHNCELLLWCFAVSIYLIRFMTLGALINKKYSNPSVLITEQINMYFHMEQNPQKKDKLMVANNVLKLVSVLLKELDSPFKISGLSANTLLYNITKFGILSACSGVLSNLLGFKLKLHNIKFK